MFKRLIRAISHAFAEGFALMAKLPPVSLRPTYPF